MSTQKCLITFINETEFPDLFHWNLKLLFPKYVCTLAKSIQRICPYQVVDLYLYFWRFHLKNLISLKLYRSLNFTLMKVNSFVFKNWFIIIKILLRIGDDQIFCLKLFVWNFQNFGFFWVIKMWENSLGVTKLSLKIKTRLFKSSGLLLRESSAKETKYKENHLVSFFMSHSGKFKAKKNPLEIFETLNIFIKYIINLLTSNFYNWADINRNCLTWKVTNSQIWDSK